MVAFKLRDGYLSSTHLKVPANERTAQIVFDKDVLLPSLDGSAPREACETRLNASALL